MGAALVTETRDSKSTGRGQGLGPLTSILLIGTSFKTSSLASRERVLRSLHGGDSASIRRLSPHVRESSLLVTCNRIEIYLATDDPDNVAEAILSRLLRGGGNKDEFFIRKDAEAVLHLFSVAAGLDSLVVGEDQILGQIRDAGKEARDSGAAGSILSSLFVAAFNVGRRVRESLEVGPSNGSVSAFALDFALEKLGRTPAKILLIGTGKTARLAAAHLEGSEIFLVSRRKNARESFPRATMVTYKQLRGLAWDGDLVISATKHTGYVLRKGDLPDDRKLVLLDLAFPRNIDPAFKTSGLIELYDLDDLAAHARLVPSVSTIAANQKVAEEAERFTRRLVASRLSPTLSHIYKWAEEVRRSETEEAMRRLPNLNHDEKRVVETMSRSIMNKLLAPHTVFVKREGGEITQEEKLHLLEDVFGSEASN